MAERILHGCGTLQFGESTGIDAMPAEMTDAFRTYRDSVSFIEEDSDIQSEYSDQSDDSIIDLETAGAKSIKLSTFDWSNETLQMLKGGTVVNGQWVEPKVKPLIIKAFRLPTADGTPFEWPKVQVFAKFNAEFKKKGVMLLEVTIKPQSQVRIGTKTV